MQDNTVFWYDDIKVLFQHPDNFYPLYDMNLVQKLNAITRLATYIGILLVLITFNYLYLYIPVGIGLFTIFIYKMQKDNVEKFFTEYDRYTCDNNKPCTEPTTDNPFMNFNNITDDRFRVFVMIIRETSKADISILFDILRNSFAGVAKRFNLTVENCPKNLAFCTEQRIEDDFNRGLKYYILENDGQACGCIALEKAGPDACYLERLAVLPERRKKGFGKA